MGQAEAPERARHMCLGFILRALPVSVADIRAKQSQFPGGAGWDRAGGRGPCTNKANLAKRAEIWGPIVQNEPNSGESTGWTQGPGGQTKPTSRHDLSCETKPISGEPASPGPVWLAEALSLRNEANLPRAGLPREPIVRNEANLLRTDQKLGTMAKSGVFVNFSA